MIQLVSKQQCVSFQEIITFLPKLVKSTEPVIKEDWRETNIVLPFEGFTKAAYPNVI